MKIFAVSDIHSYFTLFRKTLDKFGFEINNPEHLLVICGDLFDRGPEPIELYEWLKEVNNKILIKGNHEDLLIEMLERGYPMEHDVHNGTSETAIAFQEYFNIPNAFPLYMDELYTTIEPLYNSMIDYYETEKYIFTHGWIPCVRNEDSSFSYMKDWRNADEEAWKDARWYSFLKADKGIIEKDKTIICGHWHCSAAWHMYTGTPEFGNGAIFDPYHHKDFIAIDACTAYSNKCNVIEIEDNLLEENTK